jgi:anthranilate synthase component 2
MLLLIDNYDSFTYNLVHFLGELGAQSEVVRNDKIGVDEIMRKKPKAIVLSPGPCTPNEAGVCLELIEKVGGKIPLLGVCLGHQAIGQAYGGKVIRAPEPLHGKLSTIRHTGKGVFKSLPERFQVTRYHFDIVERKSLPPAEGSRPRPKAHHGPAALRRILCTGCSSIREHRVEHGHALLANFLSLAGFSPRRRNAPSTRDAA